MRLSHHIITAVVCSLSILCCNSAWSHFFWLVPQDESGSRVQLYFSEGPTPGSPKLLAKLQGIKVDAYRGDDSFESETLTLSADQANLNAASLGATAWSLTHTYGVHGTDKKNLLIYTAECVSCERVGMQDRDSVHLPAKGFTARPSFDGKKLTIALFKNGKTAKGLEFELVSAKDHQSLKTNDDGIATIEAIVPGVCAIRCLESEGTAGEYQGAKYDGTSHYTTISFIVPNLSGASVMPADKESLGAIPEAITSFGATSLNSNLYAYGGNTGSAHGYSIDQQFNKLIRLDLKNNKGWETLTEGIRVQGNALVSHGSSLILVGGFTATNAKGEKGNLVSQANVQRYDIASGKWSDLPKLPEPRSSMDAIVLEGYLYAIGGWNMQGGTDEPEWHKTAWRLPIENPSKGWEPIAAPPFQRRAVAVAAHKGRVFVIGGMNEDGDTTTETCIYDPKTNAWAEASPIAGVPLTGFGASACSVGRELIVSTVDGAIQRFNDDRQNWEIIGQMPAGRFFHRIVPISDQAFAIIGGSNMSVGKFKETPVVRISSL